MVKLTDWFKSKETPKKPAPAPKPERAFDRFLDLQQEQGGFLPDVKLTREQQDHILKSVFPVQKASLYDAQTGKYAMDEDFGFSQMRGLVTDAARSDDRIFRFYGRHSFLGWQILAMMNQNWLISNACSIPADDAVRPGWKNVIKSVSGEDMDSAEFTDATLKKYNLAEKCRQHAKNSRVFGVSYALPVIDGIDYSKPFNLDGILPGTFRGISVIDPIWMTPQWSAGALNNPASPSFYEPTYYQTNGAGRIHASHVIKLVHEEVPDLLKPSYYFGGLSLTQEIYERVYAAERTANEAPLLALTKRLLVVPTNLKTLAGKPKLAWDLIKMLVFGRDNQGIYFTEEGEKSAVHQIDTSLSDLDAVIMSQYQLVAAIARIPAHKLLKTDPKGLNNNGEYTIKDYNQELQSLQEKALRPLIERVNAIVMRADFPRLKGVKEIITEFNPIDMPTEQEKANVENLQAQAASTLVTAGILSPEEVRTALRAEKGGKYAGIDPELPAEEVPEDLDLPDDENGPEEPDFGADEWDENKHPRKDNGQFGTESGRKAQTQAKTFRQLKENVPSEVREKMEKVNIDFSKDNILPEINLEDAAELGVEAKPVRLKKTIIDRQEAKHPETRENANVLIASALYAPDIKIPGKKAGYMHFIKQLSDENHSLVLLDLQESPEGYFDVVHYFGIDDKNKKRIAKNANKKTSTEGR